MRTTDAARVNALLNDPLIRPTIGGEGILDASILLADPRNVCLLTDGGGAMFAWRGPGIFEGHSFFRVRGSEALVLGRALLGHMFEDYAARMIWGLTLIHLRHVRWFNRRLGFVSHGVMATPDGPCELFVMEKSPCPSEL